MKALGKLNQQVQVLIHFKAILSHDSFFYSLRVMIYLKGTGYSVSEEFQHKARELFVLFGGVSEKQNAHQIN